jgi:biopolymer transport protein ExbB/TolQ
VIFPYATSPGDTITNAVAKVAEALFYPVLIAALLAGLLVLYELGRLGVEAWKRSQKPNEQFEVTARNALTQARSGDSAGAQATLRAYSYGAALEKATISTLFATNPIDAQRAVIDYDLYISKRLDRVRLLVRAGPALGLMGTLIPLAPALAALGKGQPSVLADKLQTAFSITVIGVFVGLVAFTVALIRERYYTKDLADLEFLREVRGDAAVLVPATVPQPSAAAPSHMTSTDQPTAISEAVLPTGSTAAPTAPIPTPAPAAPAVAPPPAPASAAAVPGQPAAPVKSKKKFGLKKKSSAQQAPAAAFPPPPPAPAAPAAPAAPGSTPVTQVTSQPVSIPTDKSPSIPDAPASQEDDAKSAQPYEPPKDFDNPVPEDD